MSIATFPQPLYAKTEEGEQLIILAVTHDEEGVWLIGMYNDPEHKNRGKGQFFRRTDVTFEHFYWPEIEPVIPGDFQHPQEPALKVW